MQTGMPNEDGALFGDMIVFQEKEGRTAAIHMAIDEALLECAAVPMLRLYRWEHPALTFGYFNRFADVAAYRDRDCARRWTGGGIVFHGDDLTYALIIPATDPAFAQSTMSIYEQTHRAIQRAIGGAAELAAVAAVCDRGKLDSGKMAKVADRRYRNDECFANPVRADVMLDGKKIAGAAQRRTRRGLLQQGSIQHVDLAPDFEERFACALAAKAIEGKIDNRTLERAREMAAQKYATDAWLRRR